MSKIIKNNLKYILLLIISILIFSSNVNVFAEKMIDTPYGPVKALDFNLYKEYYAGRSFIEYEGHEYEAGVVTDLVLSLTEENLRKKRGETTFKFKYEHFCAPCHGNNGNGEGQFAAAGMTPAPAVLNSGTYAVSDIGKVINGGSAGVGKSNLCPPWGNTFDKAWIDGVAGYVATLSDTESKDVPKLVKAVDGNAEESGGIGSWIIIGFITCFFVGIAILEWSWLVKKK